MTIYYFSSTAGSDSNAGTSAAQPWSSFSKLSSITLHPGDEILLERGSSFAQTMTLSKASGTEAAPITIGAYGTGDDPILDSPTGKGILAANVSNYVVENIAIQNTGDAGIYGSNTNNWALHDVTFTNTGGASGNGSINWWNSTGITVDQVTINNSKGDGLYMQNDTNVLVENSTVNNVTGHNADGMQISGTNVVAEGNTITIASTSDTTKGDFVFQGSNLDAHDNVMQGGNYGMSLSANNVIVDNNVFKDHTESSWSSNINITDQVTGDKMTNVAIENNDFYNANRSITIDGMNTTPAHMVVTGLDITNNDFHDFTRTPLLLNGADVTGTYADNVYNQSADMNLVNTNSSNLTNLYQADNVYIDPEKIAALVATPAYTMTIVASGDSYNGDPVMKLYQNGVLVGSENIDASHSAGGKDTVTFNLSNVSASDVFSVEFTNDAHGSQANQDRNLYVYSVSVNGVSANLHDADLSSKVVLTKDKSDLFFSSNATATFTTSDFHGLTLGSSPTNAIQYGSILESHDASLAFASSTGSASAATTSTPMVYPATSDTLAEALDALHQHLAAHFS